MRPERDPKTIERSAGITESGNPRPLALEPSPVGLDDFRRPPYSRQLTRSALKNQESGEWAQGRIFPDRWAWNVCQESALGMAIAELEGRFLMANSAFQRMFGYNEADLLLTPLDLKEAGRPAAQVLLRQLLTGTLAVSGREPLPMQRREPDLGSHDGIVDSRQSPIRPRACWLSPRTLATAGALRTR
jgi:PAS domain-containing protein